MTETSAPGYTLTSSTGDSGTLSAAGETTATFTNVKAEPGSLTIRKTINDPSGVLDGAKPEFTFTVTFPNAEGAYALAYFSDREGRNDFKSGDTVTLTGGEPAAISGLPAGTTFTVTEEKRGDLGTYIVSSTSSDGSSTYETISGEIAGGRTVTVDVTNSFPEAGTGSLAIQKTTTGNNPDLNKQFTFRVTFTNAAGNPLEGPFPCMGSETGTISSGDTFRLSHGQLLQITGLPIGTQYTVVEADGNRGDYVTGNPERNGVIGDVEAVAAYVNHRPEEERYEDDDGTIYVRVPDPENPEKEIWIPEDEIPLGNMDPDIESDAEQEVPDTGDTADPWPALTLISAIGLLALGTDSVDRKRKGAK